MKKLSKQQKKDLRKLSAEIIERLLRLLIEDMSPKLHGFAYGSEFEKIKANFEICGYDLELIMNIVNSAEEEIENEKN